jgi:ribosomal protein L24
MKKSQIHVGDVVVCMGHPFKGRKGKVMKITRFTIHVWCEKADLLGRQLIRVRPRDLVLLSNLDTEIRELLDGATG